MVYSELISLFRRSRSVPADTLRIPMHGPAPSLRTRTPVPLETPEHLTLWEQALSRLQPQDTAGVDLNADTLPGQLLRNLINATEEKKGEIEKKKWVYLNSRGEKISYADTFLTVLNKYAAIVDIAIQHDPHVVALLWSGFRLLLQVELTISPT